MANPERLPNLASLITPLIKKGVGAREGTRRILDSGVNVGRGTLLRTWGQVLQSLSNRSAVSLAPLSRRPGPEERSIWDTTRGRGYLYQMEIQVRLKDTDIIATRLHSVRTDKLITYGAALDSGLDFLDSIAEKYGEEVLGGVMTGVYEMRPQTKFLPESDREAVERFGAGVRVTDIPGFGGGRIVRGAGGRFVGEIDG